jgi:hypothetical protein
VGGAVAFALRFAMSRGISSITFLALLSQKCFEMRGASPDRATRGAIRGYLYYCWRLSMWVWVGGFAVDCYVFCCFSGVSFCGFGIRSSGVSFLVLVLMVLFWVVFSFPF